MIPIRSGVRVWIATGHTDMRRGMNGLALQVQEGLRRDPHAGDLFVFRGRRGDLIKILWHDGGISLYAKRSSRAGCAMSGPGCPAMPMSPKPWITCSSAGPPSPASSATAASA